MKLFTTLSFFVVFKPFLFAGEISLGKEVRGACTGGGGGLPYIGNIGMCRCEGMVFKQFPLG